MSRGEVGVGIIGSQFIARAHAEALRRWVRGARLVAVASPTEAHRAALAADFGAARQYSDYRRLLEDGDVQLVIVAAPNDLHAPMVLGAAAAGKDVVVEKPLAISLAEADAMIAACAAAKTRLMYAENLVFFPKYARAREIAAGGGLGRLYLVKQMEKHSGPHSPWFWDVERAGGGVLMDMGCHGVEFARWMYGKPEAAAVTAHCATVHHRERGRGEDNSVMYLEFAGGGAALIEDSWAVFGGLDDRAEIYGESGAIFCDAARGDAMRTYSASGYGYGMEKASGTSGHSWAVFEETWHNGIPFELQHFVDCAREDREPLETGADGREVLRILYAAYESAATGRRVALAGYEPAFPRLPIESWLRREEGGRSGAGREGRAAGNRSV